jgi:hypothetical protein
LGEYDISDSAGLQILQLACLALDRATSLKAAIDRDGPMIPTKDGGQKEHPGLRSELANRSFVVKALKTLGCLDEPIKAIGRP